MVRGKIFIGSSSESRDVVDKIAERLADAGFQPMRWWTSFGLGQYTLDRLIDITAEVAGAVFIFAGDDKIWYRGSQAEQPRDNVLVEYGMFVSKVGRERTVFVPASGAKIPSDLFSITYQSISHDYETTATRIVEHFNEVFARKENFHPQKIRIAIDPNWAGNHTYPVDPNNWRMYHLYCGRNGSNSWLEASRQTRYWPTKQKSAIRKMCMEAVRKSNANTMVSLGSGASELDKELAIRLRQNNGFAKYIPVDISEILLQRSVLNTHEQINVPMGIQADFEDRILFIGREVRKYATPPILYSCIGNTFGNLDQNEDRFVISMANAMGREDMLLLHVALQGPNWRWEDDPRTSAKGYPTAYRNFISNGVAMCTRESMEKISSDFENRFTFRPRTSDVPGAMQISIYDQTSQLEVLKITRYKWEEFLAYFHKGHEAEIVFEASTYLDNGVLGDGVVLLRWPKN